MKLRQIIAGIVASLSLALTGQATTTELDWQFSSFGNPAPPTTAVDPSGGTATATFSGGVNTWFFSAASPDLFGLYGTTQTGLWDMQNSQLALNLNRVPASLLNYTLVIRQFVDPNGAFFPGTFSFSIPNAQFDGRTIVEQQTGNMLGMWVADTYHWNQLSPLGTISLNVAPGEGNGHLFLDEVKFTIVGEIAVPEPSSVQMGVAGLLTLGFYFWRRRKVMA